MYMDKNPEQTSSTATQLNKENNPAVQLVVQLFIKKKFHLEFGIVRPFSLSNSYQRHLLKSVPRHLLIISNKEIVFAYDVPVTYNTRKTAHCN